MAGVIVLQIGEMDHKATVEGVDIEVVRGMEKIQKAKPVSKFLK